MRALARRIAMAAVAVALTVTWASAQPADDRGGQPGRPDGFGPPGGPQFGPPPNPVIMVLDADRDGEISAAEIENAAAALKKLDRNNDGRLSRAEVGPPPGPAGPGMGGPDRGRRGGPAPRGRGTDARKPTEGPPMARTDQEKKILGVLDDLDKNQRRGMMNVPVEDGRLLRLLAEAIGAKHVVEVGTSNGYSGIWLCLALQTTGGRLTTYEIDARRAALARENFKRAGVDQIVTLVEGDAHAEVPKLNESVDLVFLDADKEGYIDYLNKLLPKVRPGGLIVAHNMVGQADPRYIKAITTNPDLETAFLHMEGAGVGVTLKKR